MNDKLKKLCKELKKTRDIVEKFKIFLANQDVLRLTVCEDIPDCYAVQPKNLNGLTHGDYDDLCFGFEIDSGTVFGAGEALEILKSYVEFEYEVI